MAGDVALKEKLAELEKQHRSKKRKEGQVGFSKVKVKRWTRTLRRRKGTEEDIKEEPEPTIEVIEPKPEEPQEISTPSLNTISTVMAGEYTDQTDQTTDSTLPTDSSPEESSVENASEGRRDSETPYLPPEYRPASVRSYQLDGAGPSRRAGSTEVTQSMDKTGAPGYYPAPATEDMEEAVAVVSRAEGKRPLPPPTEEEERVRHIATDDKRLLEQMRLGASAPPQADSTEDGAGPSAPHVEVDQDGFETVDELEEPRVPTPMLHPDIPAPPLPPIQRTIASEPLDELHLVPSAPPLARVASAPSAPPSSSGPSAPAPSAPPLDMEEEEEVPTPTAPSAPVLEVGDLESEEVEEDGELESEQRHPDPDQPADRPRVFLPRYEP